jgi:hypothetical protein
MACARSGSIFCWPRAVRRLPFFRKLACFDLPFRKVAAVFDVVCILPEGCDAELALTGEDVFAAVFLAVAFV